MESVTHLVSACKMLTQREYKRRNDKVCQNLHWTLCKKYGYEVRDHWYQHSPERVLDDVDKPKIFWDLDFMTEREIEHRRPDIVVFKKEPRECQLIDVAIPGDQNIALKEVEKIANYF